MLFILMKTLEQIKIEKMASKLEQKLIERKEKLRRYYEALAIKRKAEIENYYNKKLEKRTKKIVSEYNRKRIDKKKLILGKPIKEKVEKKSKEKSKALKEIQLYSKLSRIEIRDWVLMVWLADKNIYTDLLDVEWNIRSDIQWWHCYPQKNYPQLAFDINNIRPISILTNRRQKDTIGEWKKNLPTETQIHLEKKSQEIKQLRDCVWYREQYERYKTLNDNLLNAYWLHRWKTGI